MGHVMKVKIHHLANGQKELESLIEYTEYFSQMQFWTKGMYSFEIGTSDLG